MFFLAARPKNFSRLFSNSAAQFNKLYVGNLTWTTNEDKLKDAFHPYGVVVDAFLVRDRLSGKSRGFGFVEFETAEQAEDAKQALNGSTFDGRTLRVNDADNIREKRPVPETQQN